MSHFTECVLPGEARECRRDEGGKGEQSCEWRASVVVNGYLAKHGIT